MEDPVPAKRTRRIAAFSAFAIAGFPIYFIVLRIIGTAVGGRDPTGSDLATQVAEILAHPNVYASLGLVSLIVGAGFIMLALALHDHIRAAGPFAARVATTAGVVGGVLFLLAGFGAVATARWLPEIAAQDDAAALALYVVNQSVTDRQIMASSLFLGAFVLVASFAGARSGAFPRVFPYVGALAAILFVVPLALPDLWLSTVLAMVVWSAWVGVALLRGGRSVAPSPA